VRGLAPGGNFLIDGYNFFCGEYNQNQNISTGSVAYVNDVKINGRNVKCYVKKMYAKNCQKI
jgi:hypothetical protein